MTKWALFVIGVCAAVAHSAPVRLVLSIGNDIGHLGDVPLKYAETDARRVKDLFVELGAVKEEDAQLLVGQSAAEVEAGLERLAARARALRSEQREVIAMVYVSAHAARGALHLGETELALDSLRGAVSAIPASLRLLVVDACSSGALVRQKGGRRAPAVVSLGANATQGMVVISSSGPAESAQEWESLTSSLFTHHWLTGLRGRADTGGDGRVTLAEAYAYAYAETVAAASQHPSYEIDIAGSGEFILTEPLRATSAIDFSGPLEGRFVVRGKDTATIFLEFEKNAGVPLRFALPQGRYLVRQTTPLGTRLADLSLPREGVVSLGEAHFSNEGASLFAGKGREVRAWTLAMEVAVTAPPAASVRPLVGPGLWLKWQANVLWVSFGASFGAGEVDPSSTLSFVALQGAVGAGLGLGPFRFSFGLVGRPSVFFSDRKQGAFEMGAQGSWEWRLVGSLFIGALVEGLAHVLPAGQHAGTPFGGRVGLLLGLSF